MNRRVAAFLLGAAALGGGFPLPGADQPRAPEPPTDGEIRAIETARERRERKKLSRQREAAAGGWR